MQPPFPHGGVAEPSAWVQRFAGLIVPGGRVLDVACGSGRHVHWLSEQGYAVTGVDRDAGALALVEGQAELLVADLEGAPWPLPGRSFDAVVVTNYLWRPLWPALLSALAPGGVLLVETFADGQQHIGRPSRPEFLLQAGELLRLATGLRVLAFEDGYEAAAGLRPARCVQRIAALHEDPASAVLPRHALGGLDRPATPGPADAHR